MNFRGEVPNITFIKDGQEQFKVETVQYLDEQEDKVVLRFAEHVEQLKRGYACDLKCDFQLLDREGKIVGSTSDTIKDLVLVYINKNYECTSMPYIEYVFFK